MDCQIRLIAFFSVFMSGLALATDKTEAQYVELKEDIRELVFETGAFLAMNYFCESYREHTQSLDVDLIYPYKSKIDSIFLSMLEPPFVDTRKKGNVKSFYPLYEEAFLKELEKGNISNSAEDIAGTVKLYKVQHHPPKDCIMVPAYNKLLTMRINKIKDRYMELKKSDNR
ncbi:hypothetical protein K6Y31_20380 [Motilimonas cestriensis]|uniref:Uncharacterized protein n=1 Tax=Motilimonas cestriensis TaxID=2742685 RepID=A0ABS8WDL0_9GAMM|nr:hypothetical protein [Motilimonas cestriensis]MCE2597134.1 hypothetical protein [Motilimonas cestriensis]